MKWWCKIFHWKYFELHRGYTMSPDARAVTLLWCDKCRCVRMVTGMFGRNKPEWITKDGKGITETGNG